MGTGPTCLHGMDVLVCKRVMVLFASVLGGIGVPDPDSAVSGDGVVLQGFSSHCLPGGAPYVLFWLRYADSLR